LNPSSTQYKWVEVTRVGLNFEEITKQGDGRGDSKERFTEMNKDGNMKDGIGAKMIQLEMVKI
jgi:hypothetical protein